MEKPTFLADLVARLDTLDQEATIYAAEPWTADSTTLVAVEPDADGLPRAASKLGLS